MSDPSHDSTKQHNQSSAVSNSMEGSTGATASYSAPAYQLQSGEEGTSGSNSVSVPETLGPLQSGPIAVTGEGDEHQFAPNDVRQGDLGDCYFLAALMAIANTTPELLNRNISENSDGTYNVKLYKKEIQPGLIWDSEVFTPTIYQIYPSFPTTASGADTASPTTGTKPPHAFDGDTNSQSDVELWVPLFEKAYAMQVGSYSAIGNGGSRATALQALTGEDYVNISTTDNESLFSSNESNLKSRIMGMLEDDIPVTAGTGGLDLSSVSAEAQTFARDNSIAVPHAYAVISADEDSIRVRNPWGSDARVAEPVMTWSMFTELFVTFTVQN